MYARLLLATLLLGPVASHAEDITMTIAPYEVDCIGVGPMRCMQVKMGKDKTWSNFYFGIEGFTFTPGKQYTLRVRTSHIENPPADAPGTHYTLVRVLSEKTGQAASR
jgi:hypothetical protein